MQNIKPRNLTGTTSVEPREYEAVHAAIAKEAAIEGVVLLENKDNVLPLKAGSKLAVFGAGAAKTIKGGTGSGDVNERYAVTIAEGLLNSGLDVTTKKWIDDFNEQYMTAKLQWKDAIMAAAKSYTGADATGHEGFFYAYSSHQFTAPAGDEAYATDADTAIFAVARIAGESADRNAAPSDYYLSDGEHKLLSDICALYANVIVIVNAGGVIDLSFMDEFSNIKGLLIVSQPGMEGGNAIADVITGKAYPSGKLTDTWCYRYEDYPNSATFSHNNGNVSKELYEEGIYVGYRYFDTFSVPVRYGFGEGKGYTTFSVVTDSVSVKSGKVTVTATVKNTGSTAGKEVVEVYVSLPDGKLEKEFRRLAGFTKTKELASGESETVSVTFDADALTSYDEKSAEWTLEKGNYGVYVGTSLKDAKLSAVLVLSDSKTLTKVRNICELKEELKELSQKSEEKSARFAALENEFKSVDSVAFDLSGVETRVVDYTLYDNEDEAAKIVDGLTTDQLIALATGEPSRGQGTIGNAGVSVPGSAGETSSCAKDNGVANIVLADGPAGLRLNPYYYAVNGAAQALPFEMSVEHGFFAENVSTEGEKRYQFCTAIPVGTMLAQSWNMPLLEKVGAMIGEEMEEFGVQLWLAPGMNIHRNPLCGRNFEYYSEDPLVSGKCAAAITRGVQSHKGLGTTIKHYACNNQEDNRKHSDSIISERTLREIYLKGFEIAIRESQPLSIMTSYNLINGVHAANNYDTCTAAARCEFGFEGAIMTDWTTTNDGPECTAAGCMRAGNDLVMPGKPMDHENLRAELSAGTLPMDDLKRCITRLVRVILKTDCYE
jgi:beta-glucosidase